MLQSRLNKEGTVNALSETSFKSTNIGKIIVPIELLYLCGVSVGIGIHTFPGLLHPDVVLLSVTLGVFWKKEFSASFGFSQNCLKVLKVYSTYTQRGDPYCNPT